MKLTHQSFYFFLIIICFLSMINNLQAFNLRPQIISQTNSPIQYNISQSKQFQNYSVLMHCNSDHLTNWDCQLCKQVTQLKDRNYIINDVTNIVGFVGYHQKMNSIIMLFRGTEDTKNWIEDFSFEFIPYDKCKDCQVHEGFYISVLSIMDKLKSNLDTLIKKYPTANIYSVGSSLGGALAMIAGLQLQLVTGKVKQIHTFGCPRVGNQNFAQFISLKVKSIVRVVHNKDIVPHIPLLTQKYMHPPYQIWFDANMQDYKICNQSGQDSSCSDSLYPNYSAQDHISYWTKPDVKTMC